MSDLLDNTPADEVVRNVAEIIGLPINSPLIEEICENMAKEFIIQEWQLSALEASEWRAIGAPIGLASAIRKLTSVNDDDSEISQRGSSRRTLNLLSSQSTYSQRTSNSQNRLSSAQLSLSNDIEDAIHEEDSTSKEEKAAEVSNEAPFNPKCHVVSPSLKHIFETPFPISDTFDRALLHSKTDYELKAHTVFKMEIGVVISALLVGASIEMWGIFPTDHVTWDKFKLPDGGEPYIPYPMALAFHTLSGLSILIQLLQAFTYIGNLIVATAIAENKFARFFQRVMPCSYLCNSLFSIGVFVLLVNIGILLTAKTAATTSNWNTILIMGIVVPTVIITPCIMCYRAMQTYIGRTAFNGFLCLDHENPNAKNSIHKAGDSSAAIKAERALIDRFLDDLNASADNQVLDKYCNLRQPQVPKDSKVGLSSRIIRNSKLIQPIDSARDQRKQTVGLPVLPRFNNQS
jgi:hypothetical protein